MKANNDIIIANLEDFSKISKSLINRKLQAKANMDKIGNKKNGITYINTFKLKVDTIQKQI